MKNLMMESHIISYLNTEMISKYFHLIYNLLNEDRERKEMREKESHLERKKTNKKSLMYEYRIAHDNIRYLCELLLFLSLKSLLHSHFSVTEP